MRGLALLTSLAIVAAACGSTAAAPSASPVRLQTAVRTVAPATPTPQCPAPPGPPSAKATIVLEKGGTIVIQLRPDKAPKTVATFTAKANTGSYDGLTFHRVELGPPPFVIQGGDPKGDGTGGGDQATELSDLCFSKGAVGIARAGNIQISNDSQFFVCIGECRFLDGQYTNFGSVISGQDVADAVRKGDRIKTIRVE